MPASLSELFDPLFAEATQILIPNIPVENSEAFQPDSVRHIGELRADAGEDVAGFRVFDTEISLTPFIEDEPPPDPDDAPLSFFATITGFTPLTGLPNRWAYAWGEVVFNTASRSFVSFGGARNSGLSGETTALNRAEFRNTLITAAHGVLLDPSRATGTVDAIPNGTPIFLTLAATTVGGLTAHRVFSEVNAVNFACAS